MKTQTPLALSAAVATLALLPAANAQNNWGSVNPATATYVIVNPQVNGNRTLVSGGDYQTVLRAMSTDSAGAIKRRYPGATIATDANTPGAIKVTPVLNAPGALLPWAKFSAALSLKLPSGQVINVRQNFGVLEVYQHRYNAANYIFDQLAGQLP